MSLFDKLFPKAAVMAATNGYLVQTLTGYQPVFRRFNEGIYESELVRASIHALATHSSKLKPEVVGARKDLQKILEFKPNPYMDTTKFLYKTRTILEVESTCFIVPLYDAKFGEKVIGFYPVQPSQAKVVEKDGRLYIVFQFAYGKQAAIEFERVGVVSKFFYKHDFFGEDNAAIKTTLDLWYTQQQGITEGIKASAAVRFLAKVATVLKEKDMKAEQAKWRDMNLSPENNGGVAIFDSKYSEVKQIDSRPYYVNPSQMEFVEGNVFNYFGVNKDILQNKFNADSWAAFYEGSIEPFALQLSLVLTNMLFTEEQKTRGNAVAFTANRLQYATTAEKLNVVRELSDRGMLTIDEGREVFNLAPLPNGEGQKYIIRGEYYEAQNKLNGDTEEQTE